MFENQDGLMFAHLSEMCNDIQGHVFPWSRWDRQGFKKPNNFRFLNLILLMDEASFGVLHDVVSHIGPEVAYPRWPAHKVSWHSVAASFLGLLLCEHTTESLLSTTSPSQPKTIWSCKLWLMLWQSGQKDLFGGTPYCYHASTHQPYLIGCEPACRGRMLTPFG